MRFIRGMDFLSERAALARLCETAGHRSSSARRRSRSPPPATSCARAPKPRRPMCPWCPAARSTRCERRVTLARAIGVPLLVKAVGGGGGRGMKRVERVEDLPRRARAGRRRGGARHSATRASTWNASSTRGASRRSAGARRWRRQGHPPGRARLLGAAPLSEAHRGDAGARTCRRGCATHCTRPRCASRSACLSRRRHGGIPGRRAARRVLLSRDERAHPGRASGHRGRDRRRSRRRADRHRGRQRPAAARSPKSASMAAPSNAASTPRIQRTTSAQSRAGARGVLARGRRASASTLTSPPARAFRRSTIR